MSCDKHRGVVLTWSTEELSSGPTLKIVKGFCDRVKDHLNDDGGTARETHMCKVHLMSVGSGNDLNEIAVWEVRHNDEEPKHEMADKNFANIANLCTRPTYLPERHAMNVLHSNQEIKLSDGNLIAARQEEMEKVIKLVSVDFLSRRSANEMKTKLQKLEERIAVALAKDNEGNMPKKQRMLSEVEPPEHWNLLNTMKAVYDTVNSGGRGPIWNGRIEDISREMTEKEAVTLASHFTAEEKEKRLGRVESNVAKGRQEKVDSTMGMTTKNSDDALSWFESKGDPELKAKLALVDPTKVYEKGYLSGDSSSCWVSEGRMGTSMSAKMITSALSRCVDKHSTKEVCMCTANLPAETLDSASDVCFITGPHTRQVEVIKESTEHFDLCSVYCKRTRNLINGNTETPLYRSSAYRTPLKGLKRLYRDSLEERQDNKMIASNFKENIEECWAEGFEDFMADPKKQAMRSAIDDGTHACPENDMTGMRDLLLLPSSCIENRSVVVQQKHIHSYKETSTNFKLCAVPLEICYNPHCLVIVTATSTSVKMELKSKYAKYMIKDNKGNLEKGHFLIGKTVHFEFAEPGHRHITGICNKNRFERRVMFSNKEYCDEKYSGYADVFQNIYCKRPKTVKITLTIIVVSVVLYLCRHLLTGILGVTVSLILSAPLTLILSKSKCPRCNCIWFSKNHVCKNFRCKRCAEIYYTRCDYEPGDIELSTSRNAHMKVCRNRNTTGSNLEHAVRVGYRSGVCLAQVLFKIVPGLASLVAAAILITMLWSKAEASRIDHHTHMTQVMNDLSEYIEDMKTHGFHPYQARAFHGLREKLESIEETNDCATRTCNLVMKIRANFEVTKGREFGFTVTPKSNYGIKNFTGVSMNVKFADPQRLCQYKEIYRTGKAQQEFRTGDTCTDYCNKCIEDLLKDPDVVKAKNLTTLTKNTHSNTASWACDGPGCAAINQGCTCGVCWCKILGDEYSVRELVKEEQRVSLCIQASSEGFCKKIGPEERTNTMTVVKAGELVNKCPKRIACKQEESTCYEGEISGLGDFSDKFGSLKKLSDGFTSYKEQVHYSEQCLFAKHRYFEYHRCCKDTYQLHDTLKPISFKRSSPKNKPDTYILPVESAGTWEIQITLPPMIYNKEADELKLTEMSISDCMGCYDCEEGGACLLHYKSNFDSTPTFTCDQVHTDISHITLKRGAGSTPFNIYSKEKTGNMTCQVAGKDVEGSFNLVNRPLHPHGDGVIKMDGMRVFNSECGTIFCNLRLPRFGIPDIKTIMIIIVASLAGIVALVLLVRMIMWAARGYKSAYNLAVKQGKAT